MLILVDEGGTDRLNDAFAQVVDICGFTDPMKRDDEFVTPQSRHEVAVTGVLTQARRNSDQDLIAGRMTKGVVHRLEAVEVDVEQGQDRAATRRCQVLFEVVAQAAAVGQPCQCVMLG